MRAAPRFVLALDQGTTSSRAILFDAADAPAGVAHRSENAALGLGSPAAVGRVIPA